MFLACSIVTGESSISFSWWVVKLFPVSENCMWMSLTRQFIFLVPDLSVNCNYGIPRLNAPGGFTFCKKNLQKGFLAHLSTKCSVSFCDPSMSGVRRSCVRASVRLSTISLNYISSETTYWILTKLHRNDPWVVPYQSCSNRSSWLHK